VAEQRLDLADVDAGFESMCCKAVAQGVQRHSGKTKTARLWAYVRDERPWVGDAPQAAWYQF